MLFLLVVSKLLLDQMVGDKYDRQVMTSIVRAICNQENSHAEGRISARYQARSVVPGASFAAQVGDVVWNLNPTVVNGTITGTLVGNYIVEKWICTFGDAVNPIWKEVRVLTP